MKARLRCGWGGWLAAVLIGIVMTPAARADSRTINCASSGTAFNTGIRGQNPMRGDISYSRALLYSTNTSMRSMPAGGKSVFLRINGSIVVK